MSVKPDADKAAAAMDWLTFIASIVGSLAWPIAAFAIAFMFRTQIIGLLERMRRLSLGGNAVEFAERLTAVEADAQGVTPDNPPEALDERTVQLIEIAPEAAINDRWLYLDIQVQQLAARLPEARNWRTQPPFLFMCKKLYDTGVISAKAFALLGDLYELRNQVVASGSVSASQAVRFLALADKTKILLEGADLKPDRPE